MTSYPICKISFNISPKNLKLKFIKIEENNIAISKSIAKYLYGVKEEIEPYSHEWDIIKKLTNPYEFIHTPLPGKGQAISKIKPLSRAFFKLIEICNTFDIFKSFENRPIKTFHLAEGPGGFIEALTYLRFNKKDKYYGMTLLSQSNDNIPGWKKATDFLIKNKNIIIEQGIDKTGNLYNPNNFEHCIKKYSNSMDLITGDGGFDFSVNYNKQEVLAHRLILTQIAYTIGMQAYGGHFILKVFDLFTQTSIDMIYILASYYKTIYIIKPNTSRLANSEKYIVCIDFQYRDTTEISNKFLSILYVLNNMKLQDIYLSRILDIDINYQFLKIIEETNAIIGQQQISNILSTLRIIQNKEKKGEKIQLMRNKNIQKCINWCVKNRIPHNRYGISTNIFLSSPKF